MIDRIKGGVGRALFIWDADYPWDVRVEKICTALCDAGWVVHLVCRNTRGSAREEDCGGIHVHRITPPAFSGRLASAFTFPAFFSPLWLAEIWRVARTSAIDLIVVRDLPMAPAGLMVGKSLGVPVVLDMAECYPELIRAVWQFEPFRPLNLLVRNPLAADVIEMGVLRRVDHVFCMVDEARQRLLQRGIPEGRMSIVSNTPIIEGCARLSDRQRQSRDDASADLVLAYVGFLNWSRGLEFVLRALASYVRREASVRLRLIGKGNAEVALRNLTAELGLSDYVEFLGWVDHSQVSGHLLASNVGLVPHYTCGHWNSTIPNKLFDYMSLGIPVLSTNVKPMARIIGEEHCGEVFRDRDTQSFISCLDRLRNPVYRRTLGANGERAVRLTYNWATDRARMLDVFAALRRGPVKNRES
jgi:glycosyltransferase involved in cell wall biosynthesis